MDEILKYCVALQFKVYAKGHWLYFEVHFLLLSFLAFVEKSMNYSVAKWVDGELGDSEMIIKWSKHRSGQNNKPEKILACQKTLIAFVQASKSNNDVKCQYCDKLMV